MTTPSRTDTAPTEAVRANGLAKWWVRTPCSHAKRPSVSRATTRSGLASTTWGWTMTCRLEDGGEVLTPTARVSLPRVRDRSSVRVRVVGSSGVSRNGLVRPGAHARPSGSHRGVDPDARRAEPGRPVVDHIDEGSDDRLCPARQCGDHRRYQGTFVVCQGWLSRTRSPRGRWPSSCRPCGQVSGSGSMASLCLAGRCCSSPPSARSVSRSRCGAQESESGYLWRCSLSVRQPSTPPARARRAPRQPSGAAWTRVACAARHRRSAQLLER